MRQNAQVLPAMALDICGLLLVLYVNYLTYLVNIILKLIYIFLF